MPKNRYLKKLCKKHGIVKFILEGRGYYRCTECRKERVSQWRRNTKKRLVRLFGGKCKICGYDKSLWALDFHHINPEDKSFGLSAKGRCRAFHKLVDEADKCVLICKNCHAEKHDNLYSD